MATGLQKEFSWAGVAASGVGAAVGNHVGRSGFVGNLSDAQASVVRGTASAIANAATRSALEGSSFGDNIVAALPSVIGQTIGQGIADNITKASNDAKRAEKMNSLSYEPHSEVVTLDGPFAPASRSDRGGAFTLGGGTERVIIENADGSISAHEFGPALSEMFRRGELDNLLGIATPAASADDASLLSRAVGGFNESLRGIGPRINDVVQTGITDPVMSFSRGFSDTAVAASDGMEFALSNPSEAITLMSTATINGAQAFADGFPDGATGFGYGANQAIVDTAYGILNLPADALWLASGYDPYTLEAPSIWEPSSAAGRIGFGLGYGAVIAGDIALGSHGFSAARRVTVVSRSGARTSMTAPRAAGFNLADDVAFNFRSSARVHSGDITLGTSARRIAPEGAVINHGLLNSLPATTRAQVERYAHLTYSNQNWTWPNDISDNLTRTQTQFIRRIARQSGLIHGIDDVIINPVTRDANFGRQAIYDEVLPQSIWNQSHRAHQRELEAMIGRPIPDGYTLHHMQEPGRVQVVPFGLHRAIDHVGGQRIWGSGRNYNLDRGG